MNQKNACLGLLFGLVWAGYGCSSEEAPSRFPSSGAGGASGTSSGSTTTTLVGTGTVSATTGIMTTGSGSGTGGGGNAEDPTTCAAAAAGRTYVGCDFWPTVTSNPVWSVFDFAVVVANAGTQAAEVKVERAGAQVATATVPPGGLEKIFLPWVKELKGGDFDMCTVGGRTTGSIRVDKGAYHMTSTFPVIAWQFNPLEYKAQGGPPGKAWQCPFPPMACNSNGVDCLSVSNDASLLLPTSAMTSHYRFFGKSGSRGLGGAMNRETPGAYAITATQDGTTVDVFVARDRRTLANPASAPTGIAPGGTIPATPALGMATYQMNAGDVIQLMGAEGPFYNELHFDLSGSTLDSHDKPVQVISLIPITDIPVPETANNGYADHVEESVLPAEVLGKHYFVAPPSTPKVTTVGHYIRFYGNFDNTALTYPSGGAPPGAPTTLNAADVIEIGPVNTSFEVVGSQSFAIGSYMMGGQVQDPSPGGAGSQGDPAFSQEVTVEQFRKKYIFLAPDDYNVAVADILVPDGANVMLDGMPLTAQRERIGMSTWSIVREKLTAGANHGTHVLDSNLPIGLQVVAFGHATGIYYPGGLNLTIISDPPPPPR